MPRFIVGRMERHCQPIEIDARNEEEALAKAINGEGNYEESQMEYVEALDPSTWTIERIMEVDFEAPLCLSLWHGRNHPDEDLEDWGEDGPIFFIYDIHVTYNTAIRLSFGPSSEEEAEILFFEDTVYYDGVFYGDWTVFSSKGISECIRCRAALYDPNKARIPEQIRRKAPRLKQGVEGGRKLNIPR